QRQELRLHLGIEAIRLAGTLGDDAQLLGMGQDQPICQRLKQQPQPLITGGSLDNGLEGTQGRKELADLLRRQTRQRLSRQHLSFLVNNANADSLLVEVDADEVHGALLVWNGTVTTHYLHVYHEFRDTGTRLDLLPI